MSSRDEATPRYATERTSRPTRGGQVAKLAEVWGRPLMPWQRQVVDAALEYDEASGRPAYREVWVTVPRQSGKTLAMAVVMLERAIARVDPQRIAYTAQTGWDARKKLIEDIAPEITGSPLGDTVTRVLRGAGMEAVEFKNGSRIEVLPSTPAAGHGKTLDLGVIDEAFHDGDLRREQSMIPAMATKPDAQILGISTAGTDASVLLNRKVEQGRRAVAEGADSGIAYFEWSAAPDDADRIGDPKLWATFMPALGHTIDESVVQHAFDTMELDEFLRAFGNIPTIGDTREIPPGLWDAVALEDAAPAGGLAVAVDCTPDRSHVSVVVADADGQVEVVDHRTGTGWVVDRVTQVAAEGHAVFVDEGGPAGTFCDPLEAAGVEVVRLGTREFVQACSGFYDAIVEQTIRVRPSAALDAAVVAAAKRSVSDSWAWARKVGSYDVSPLVAASIAVWGTQHLPEREAVEMYVGFS